MKRARTATQSADFSARIGADWALARARVDASRVGKGRVTETRGGGTCGHSQCLRHHHQRWHLSAKAVDFCECGNGAATRSLINNEHVAATSG